MKRNDRKSAQPRTGAKTPEIKPSKDAKRKLSSAASETMPDGGGAAGLAPASYDLEHVVQDQDMLMGEMMAARQSNHVAAAIDLADRLRRQYPDAESGYQFGAAMLKDSARFNEAAAVLAAAGARFAGRFWLLSEQVLLAQKSGDCEGAVTAAQTMRERFPDHFLGWRTGFIALKNLGRTDEAESLLDEALSSLPAQEWLANEALQRALRVSHMQDVARYGKILRTLAPRNSFGWKAEINALRNLGRLDEADKTLMQAGEMFPGEEWVLASAVTFAARRGDWQAVGEQAECLRQAFPRNEEGWIGGLQSLRHMKRFDEATDLLKEAEAAQPAKPWLLTEAANLSQAASNLNEASQRWRRVRDLLPHRQEGYVGGFQVLLGLGRVDEAESLLLEASATFPQTPWLLSCHAQLAQQRGDHDEAVQRWSKMLEVYPDNEQPHRGIYKAKRHLGELDEADLMLQNAFARSSGSRWVLTEAALLAEARYDFAEANRRWTRAAAAFPNDAEIALKHAMVLSLDQDEARRDWPETMARLRELHEHYPEFVEGWRSHVYALRVQGLSSEAEQLAADCLRTMPDETELWLQHAFAAADQDAPEQAGERLRDAAKRFPTSLKVQNAYAEALARLDNLDEADLQYRRGLEQFPHSVDMACGHAAIAARRQDWPEALRRWTAAYDRFPKERRAAQGILDAHAALGEGDVMAPLPLNSGDADTHQTERGKLFWQFESLGGTGQGCEFGIVQRIAGGAEPLGLLRWSAVAPEKLVEALDCRFDGVGTPAQTFIDFYGTSDPSNPEYRCRDTRFETVMHTFVFKKDMPEQKMFTQTCRRMAFLRRKLIQDLEEGSKVFVYKIFQRSLSDEELAELHRAMRGYGSNTLLYVRYADARNPSGTVIQRDKGLLIGYISGFSMTFPEGRPRAPDLPAWTAICKAALALHNSCRQKAERVLEAQ